MKVPGWGLRSAALAAVIGWPGAGWAHAIDIKSDPDAGSRVRGPMLGFRLQYNSRIDPARSRLELNPPDGSARPLSTQASDSLDSVSAHADGLTPGSYRLHWQVLSVDGHITRGDIPFEVTPPDK